MSDETPNLEANQTNVPAFIINAGTVTASRFSVHVVAGNELPDGRSVPRAVITLGTEFAEELANQLLRAVAQSRERREERPVLVAEK